MLKVVEGRKKSWEFDAALLETSVMTDGKSCMRRGMEPYMYDQD